MININFRYVYEDVDRHGNVRIYFWRKPGKKVRIREKFGSEPFMKRYHELLQASEAGQLSTSPDSARNLIIPGTFRWLCIDYFRSVKYRRLDPSTQKVRRRVLESIFDEPIYQGAQETFADFPLARMTAKSVRVLRDRKADLPESANARLKAIRQVFSWGIEQEHVAANPARDVSRIKSGSTGFHSWTLEEIEKFEQRHAVGTRARLALALLTFTGARRSDVVLLGKQHVRDGWLKCGNAPLGEGARDQAADPAVFGLVQAQDRVRAHGRVITPARPRSRLVVFGLLAAPGDGARPARRGPGPPAAVPARSRCPARRRGLMGRGCDGHALSLAQLCHQTDN